MKIIGHNQIEDDAATRQSWEKLKGLNELISQFCFATNTDVVNDLKTFEKDPLKYAIDTIKAKNPEAKILGLSDKGYCNLYGYNLDHLTDLFSRYVNTPGDIEYDAKTKLFDVPKDRTQYDIVAQTPLELERYSDAMALINALNTLRLKSDSTSYLAGENIFKFIDVCNENNCYVPSTYYIKQA